MTHASEPLPAPSNVSFLTSSQLQEVQLRASEVVLHTVATVLAEVSK